MAVSRATTQPIEATRIHRQSLPQVCKCLFPLRESSDILECVSCTTTCTYNSSFDVIRPVTLSLDICLAIEVSSSYTTCAAANAVCSPAPSYDGATSTTSAPTMFNPSRLRRTCMSSLVVHPPGSGVPVPGASPGSNVSMSTDRYTGLSLPMVSIMVCATPFGPSSSDEMASLSIRFQPCELSRSLSSGPPSRVRRPAWTELLAMRPSLAANQNCVPCVKALGCCSTGSSGSSQYDGYAVGSTSYQLSVPRRSNSYMAKPLTPRIEMSIEMEHCDLLAVDVCQCA